MRIDYDEEADYVFFHLVEEENVPSTNQVYLADTVILDLDKNGRPIGLDIVGVKDRFPENVIDYFKANTLPMEN